MEFEDYWYVPIIIIVVASPLIYTRKLHEYIWHLIFFSSMVIFDILITRYFSIHYKINWNKATIKELNAEDNVLLQGIGLFQGILFIYIIYIEDVLGQSFFIQIIKWTIPLFIFIFYVLRGYGHIKNSPKHRTYSSLIIIYYIMIEILSIINYYISNNFKIMVGDDNLIQIYFIYAISTVSFIYFSKIRRALRIRYDY